jgi:hypothetical protein
MNRTKKIKTRPSPSIYGVSRGFARRRAALKVIPGPFQKNKHSFLDPWGWPFFPRPALRDYVTNPRSPLDASRFFLRETEYQRPP